LGVVFGKILTLLYVSVCLSLLPLLVAIALSSQIYHVHIVK
jgi:hypothetical protein